MFIPAKFTLAKYTPAKYTPAKYTPAKFTESKFTESKFTAAKFTPTFFTLDKFTPALVLSSSLFILPGIYAIFVPNYVFVGVSVVTTVVSVGFWINAVDGIRRDLDLITAKASFLFYFANGLLFIRDDAILTIGLATSVVTLVLYWQSCKFAMNDSPDWIYYHFFFHLFVSFGQLIVVYYVH